MSKKVILIHGWDGSPDNGWLLWLKNKLRAENWEVVAPQMPNADKPDMKKWLEYLDNTLPNVDENCYFVGHSLGCITILRYLEQLLDERKIGGTILVAGFMTSLGYPELKNFFQNEIDWKKIKQHCNNFTAIHSDNDPFVSVHYADLFQKFLSAEKIIQNNQKHFSADDGINELPVVYQTLKNMSNEIK